MMHIIGFILCLAGIFTAVLLSLTLEERLRSRITGILTGCSAVMGVILYGIGYSQLSLPIWVKIPRAMMAVARMFIGVNDLASIEGTPAFSASWMLVLFWVTHFLAFYAMASTVMAALGERLLRNLRLFFSLRGKLLLIYGLNEDAMAYASTRAKQKGVSVVFVAQAPDSSMTEKIRDLGATWLVSCTGRSLRALGVRPGKRKLELAVLSDRREKNLQFAIQMLRIFENEGISPVQTSLVLSGISEEMGMKLLSTEDQYGFGSVLSFDRYELAARSMIQRYPPCEKMTFDSVGRATEDFGVIVFGFGRMGQEMLRQVIQSAQFPGSAFHAEIFDRRGEDSGIGLFHPEGSVPAEYRIHFHQGEILGAQMFRFLKQEGNTCHLILQCIGNQKLNQELCDVLTEWYKGREHIPRIIQCSINAVFDSQELEKRSLFTDSASDLSRMDHMAMEINRSYHENSDLSAETLWNSCDFFSRMSCRASADFFPAVLQASGRTAEDVLAGNWPPDPQVMDTLSQMEHLRWCAFHRMMGYETMSPEEFDRRGAAWQAGQLREKIGKDTRHRRHACLIPWEELPALDLREEKWTGKKLNYQQMDYDNIMALPRLLQVLKEEWLHLPENAP